MLALATALLATLSAGLELRPASAKPGDAVLLVVTGGEKEPTASIDGRAIRFWRAGDGWRAVAGLPIETPIGSLPITVQAVDAPITATLTVVDPAFPSKVLTLPPKYVEPPAAARARIAADQRAFLAAFDQPFAPPRFEAPFAWPLVSELTGGYGDRRTYNGKLQGQHYGLDLDAATGTPIAAANAGTVVMARDNYYAGNTVLLWHGADLYTAYFHLSRIDVKVGQAVAGGERIGLAGATGRATGPHLHWGLKAGGRWVDPRSVLLLGDLSK
jgi:murein DD-endopeptidase MepM/ murein hydrolase activator NlpD